MIFSTFKLDRTLQCTTLDNSQDGKLQILVILDYYFILAKKSYKQRHTDKAHFEAVKQLE